MTETEKKDNCPVCGGTLNPDTGKCSVCGEAPPSGKKEGGKRLQISMVKDISDKQASKDAKPDENGEKPELATKPSKVSNEDNASTTPTEEEE